MFWCFTEILVFYQLEWLELKINKLSYFLLRRQKKVSQRKARGGAARLPNINSFCCIKKTRLWLSSLCWHTSLSISLV